MDKLQNTISLINHAIQQRQSEQELPEAHRLFNGFYEGHPGLVLDRYGKTLVILDHGQPGEPQMFIKAISDWAIENIEGLNAVLLKKRQHTDEQFKNGMLIFGRSPTKEITEFGVRYALDLQMNQDASFYLDTRNLRLWLSKNMAGQRVLNTFAYTGSLGVAAGAGGAMTVVQTDIKNNFLQLAQKSWELNDFPEEKCEIIAEDFFRVSGKMRLQDRLFDCVILDPPFFSTTDAGKVDLESETTRLINKVRPLVAHEGWLVIINNALFLSGAHFMAELNELCKNKYLTYEGSIPVPNDITGYPNTIIAPPPADPAPFNHPTKIATIRVTRKDNKK